jgi:hypothetical protein
MVQLLPGFHRRHLAPFQWVVLVLWPYLLQVDLALVVDFLQEVEVVRVGVGLVSVLPLVDLVWVVDFLWVEVVPVVLEWVSGMPLAGLKKVVWN